MKSVFETKQCAWLQKINAATGVFISKENYTHAERISKLLWEVIAIFFIVGTLITNIPYWRYTFEKSSSTALIVCNLSMILHYFVIICRSIDMVSHKTKLRRFLETVDRILESNEYSADHNNIKREAWKIPGKILICQIFILLGSQATFFLAMPSFDKDSQSFDSVEYEIFGGYLEYVDYTNIRVQIFTVANFLLNLFMWIKIYAMDCLIYFFIVLIAKEINLLRKNFSFRQFSSPSCESFAKWTQQFESIKSFVVDFNDLFSNQIILAIFDQTLALCFTGYISAKYFTGTVVLAMATVFLNGFSQNLIYCVLGQSVVNEAEKLMSQLSSGTWSRQNMFPVCHVLLSTVKRNFTLCIGNFFTLNMEFFASVIGIVFTYFMILRQF
ncbi:Hypothetical predicted protein [Cloeon dipterum]|uniref:Odorant receptor n=1 Tax=Cloeon dipterum TaxID=197152 RepID=A0A8S1CYH1_9INSE|nr:Hypothetical predicted protein [Cloeon dipterum]